MSLLSSCLHMAIWLEMLVFCYRVCEDNCCWSFGSPWSVYICLVKIKSIYCYTWNIIEHYDWQTFYQRKRNVFSLGKTLQGGCSCIGPPEGHFTNTSSRLPNISSRSRSWQNWQRIQENRRHTPKCKAEQLPSHFMCSSGILAAEFWLEICRYVW